MEEEGGMEGGREPLAGGEQEEEILFVAGDAGGAGGGDHCGVIPAKEHQKGFRTPANGALLAAISCSKRQINERKNERHGGVPGHRRAG